MFTLKLIVRNAFRHKLRTSLTVLGIVIALISFGLLRTVINAWYSGVAASSATRLVTRNAISLAFFLPISYKDKIRQVEGVKTVSWGNWFGGIYIDEKHFFANFAVEPRSYLELYPEYVLKPGEKEAFLRDRKGAMVGRKLAARYGWQVGDTVTLKGTIWPGNWDFVVRAIYRGRDENVDETLFVFHWSYLNETVKKTVPRRADLVGFYMIGVGNPDFAAETAAGVDRIFENSLAETHTETEKAFQLGFLAMSEALLVVIQLVSLLVILIIMAVVANTMAMTYRERIGEYAIFKTLGFGGWRIAAIVSGESLVITVTGCALAAALTYPVTGAFAKAMGQYFPIFHVKPRIFLLYGAASVFVGLTAAVIPTWRAARMSIAQGLRRIG
jgi:putative ABC transport system permease protein